MKRAWFLCACVALAVLPAAPAVAQPAEAIGQPLPDPTARDGTIGVRVVAGDRSKPVSGTEVTLRITPPDGTSPEMERRARTDADGRATFTNVSPNAMVQAAVPGEDGEMTSSRFAMPGTGGAKLLLSTVPFAGMTRPGAAGAPQGPMTPRLMSGQPRPQQGDRNDTTTVRLSYDDFADPTPPRDQPVLMIGYRFDLHVEGKVLKTDAAGRAVFDKLDRRGATTYFALTLLPRGDDVDRLVSVPFQMPGDVGVRLMLAGDKRSVGVAADDQAKIEPQPTAKIPAGEVSVALDGLVQGGEPVELLDALTGKVLVTTKVGPPIPNLESMTATWGTGADDPALSVGTLVLSVGANGAPASGETVTVRRKVAATAAAPAAPAEQPWSATVDAKGEATLTGLPTATELEVVVTIQGLAQPPRPLTLAAAAGRREQLAVAWRPLGRGAARFTGVTGGPERAFLVRAFLKGQPCLSVPFMMPANRGVFSTVMVYPRVLFGFALRSWIDDEYLGVTGKFAIQNNSHAPFLPGTMDKIEELTIPLPRGFVGATVRQDFAEEVGVDPSRGFIVRRPVPPGGIEFIAAFSLKTDDGELTWDMEMPYGTFGSGMEIKRTPDMELELPARAKAREVDEERGRWYVVEDISVPVKERMVFKFSGLPQRPTWQTWGRNIIGLLVLLVVLGAIALIVWPKPKDAAEPPTRAKYDRLLDELAGLQGDDEVTAARREQLLAELEALHPAGAARS